MQFKELIDYLDGIYPRSLSLPGDNDGIDVCVDYNIEIGGVLIVLDITMEAIEYAKAHAYNCIISHHTMLFVPINKLDVNAGIGVKKAAMLARADICAASFHTRLDAVTGGVNDCLLAALGIKSSEPLICDNVPIGRISVLDEEISTLQFSELADKSLKQFYKDNFKFELKGCVKYADSGKKIKKLASVGGSGMSFIELAVKAGADAFFTGEGKYLEISGACEYHDISIITAGHIETEAVVLPELKRAVLARFPKTRVDYFIDNYGGLI